MALVKKGSRILDVDGVSYRWRLRGRPTYDQGLGQSPINFAVELEEQPGTTLVVKTNQPHSSNWVNAPSTPVLSVHVTRAVRTALAKGWRPADQGKPFILDLSAGFVRSRAT